MRRRGRALDILGPAPYKPAMITLFWDFFGPRAAGTAQHFQVHLRQFLQRHDLQDCATGITAAKPLHHAVWCAVPAAQAEPVQAALRPQRTEGADRVV